MSIDLENEKFVKSYFTLSTKASSMISAKKELKEYAEELGWVIDIDKKGHVDETGERWFQIKVRPQNELMSPEELREKREILRGFCVSIMRDIIYLNRQNEMPKNVEYHYRMVKDEKNKNEWIIEIDVARIFYMECNLRKLISLEKKDKNLIASAFGFSMSEAYKQNIKQRDSFFSKKDGKESAKQFIKVFQECNI